MGNTKHIVGFSGGIDSQACALWVRQRFPAEDVILLNSQAGRNEHPVTVSFVQFYSDTIFPVIECVPLIKDLGNRGTEEGATRDRRQEFSEDDELTFDRLAYVKGRFPSRKAQFCTEHLKLAPQRRWCEENLLPHGIDFERYVGVRREEGRKPACTDQVAPAAPGSRRPRGREHTPDREWDDYFDCEINYPLAHWTKAECFEFVKAAGEEINPLYTMGFGRVGCAPCINSSKEDIRQWAARFPEMIDKLRRWEQQNGRTFFAPCIPNPAYAKALREWRETWTTVVEKRGKSKLVILPGAPPKPESPINWIDEVVQWSRTSRGGKRFELPFLEADAAAGSCSSKYGLCE